MVPFHLGLSDASPCVMGALKAALGDVRPEKLYADKGGGVGSEPGLAQEKGCARRAHG
jgi:hypothetical protein